MGEPSLETLYERAVQAGGHGPAVDALFAHPTFTSLVNRVATRMGHRYGLREPDDVRQYVRMAALAICREKAPWAAHVGSFPAALHLHAQDVVRAYAQSAGAQGVSGASGVWRRQAELSRLARDMASSGTVPDPQHVVDVYNARALEARKNPTRQGAVARVSDLSLRVLPLHPEWDASGFWPDGVLLPLEAAELVDRVVARCEQISPQLGSVAAAWLSGDVRSPREVAEHTGLSPRTLTRLMARVSLVARQVLADEFDIHP